MRFVFYVLLLGTALKGQQLHLLSARDSLRIPFASVLIRNETLNYSKTASDKGIVQLTQHVVAGEVYTLAVHCFGFQKWERVLNGAEIADLGRVFLTPANVNLEEVVVTAQYEPLPAEQAVQKMTVISNQTIRQMAAVNLRDVLTNQMNVRLSQDNILGSGMSLQGIKGENVKILVDGVPVIGRLDGNIDLSQINMNNVERIELIEGPLSVQYGTNALAGTINIITKKTPGRRFSASATGYYEGIGTYNLSGESGVAFGRHELLLNLGRNYFDGWNSGDRAFVWPKVQLADSTRFKQWKSKEQVFGGLSYRYAFINGEVGLKSGGFKEVICNRGYPRGPYGESAFDDYYHTQRFDNSLSFNSRLSARWTMNMLNAFNLYQRVKSTLYRDLTTLRDTLSGNAADQDTSGFKLVMSRASFVRGLGSRLNWEMGYDINHESASGKRIERQVKNMGDYAVFATAEYKPLQQLIVKPGLRYAYNTAYNTPLVPSINLKWSLSANHSLRTSYAQGFRAPTIKELYFFFVDINHNIIGNAALRSERSDNYSLSYTYSRDVRGCRVKFSSTGFYNSIFNLISLAQVNSMAYSYVNIGRYKTTGIQLENSLTFPRLLLQTGFNYTGRYNVLSESDALPRYSYSPELLANLSYRFPKQRATIAMFYKFTGRLPGYALNDGLVTQTTVQSYSMMDLTLTRSFWRNRVSLALGCKNLFDVQNINATLSAGGAHSAGSSSLPLATGRNYFIQLRYTLNSK